MALRPLTQIESAVARAVVELGSLKGWEFAAFLEAPTGPLIELRTLMKDDGADPSQDVHNQAAAGKAIILHHNHLTQESLSFPDWIGLANLFSETWAHCADGTTYWGRVKNAQAVTHIIGPPPVRATNTAENELFNIPLKKNHAQAADLSSFFRKEVINRAMRLCGHVEYDYAWYYS